MNILLEPLVNYVILWELWSPIYKKKTVILNLSRTVQL